MGSETGRRTDSRRAERQSKKVKDVTKMGTSLHIYDVDPRLKNDTPTTAATRMVI